MQTSSKQIRKIIAARVGLAAFAATNAASDVITSALTTALASAGDDSQGGVVGVPVQVSTGLTVEGVITSANNKCAIFNSAGDAIKNGDNIVYGRLSETSGVYTVQYFTDEQGVETPYTMSAQAIDVWINYRFSFMHLPADALVSLPLSEVDKTAAGVASSSVQKDVLSVTAINTLSNLTKTPVISTSVLLIVNGQVEDADPANGITVTGKAVAINPANLQYDIDTTDRVVAYYTTSE